MPDFLRECFNDGREVTVYTINGYQMHGVLTDIDEVRHAILLDTKEGKKYVFMSAISTIS